MVRSMSLLVALSVSAPALAFGYGEAGAAKQSLPERALHFHTDRLRVDPGAADSTFDDLPAVRPLILADELAAAARFYAEDMAANGCFPADHSSCDGTSFSARVGSFYSSLPIGENIARGQPTAEVAVFDSWLYSDGHRANMLDADWNEIGTGHPVETPDDVWVQDFGGRAGSEEPIITSAIHAPLLAAPDDVITFFAAAYDPDGASLRGVTLVAEDACHFMDPDLGSDGMETWAVDASVSAEAGCFKYWLAALRDNGEEVAFPTEGSLQVSVGDVTCEPWTSERTRAACAPPTFTGSGAGCGGSGAGYGPDANIGGNAEYGTCAVGTSANRGSAATLLLALFAGVRRRRQASGGSPRSSLT